jgi:hypothetical protein
MQIESGTNQQERGEHQYHLHHQETNPAVTQ